MNERTIRGKTVFQQVAETICRCPSDAWTPGQVANALGLPRRSCDAAMLRLVEAGCLAAGGTNSTGTLYQWVPGATIPDDRRGRHGSHPSGPAWGLTRRRKAALRRARAKRRAERIAELTLGSIASLLKGRS